MGGSYDRPQLLDPNVIRKCRRGFGEGAEGSCQAFPVSGQVPNYYALLRLRVERKKYGALVRGV
jgi:hypothetical protein